MLVDNFVSWVSTVDKVTNLEALGQLLYTYYFIYFLIAGIILLVAMVGAIVLTLQFNKTVKNQLIFRQLSRSADSAVFLARN
jgi:NADH-quinone oxidoreductase subunit J